MWRSKGLSERDLCIPKGNNTNPTGSMGFKKGDWAGIDQRHYFRDDVFAALTWTIDRPQHEIASAGFELWIDGQQMGNVTLTIRHNADTTSTTYQQNNEMTHLRWGEAKPWVGQRSLLGHILWLERERTQPGTTPRFRIRIEPP